VPLHIVDVLGGGEHDSAYTYQSVDSALIRIGRLALRLSESESRDRVIRFIHRIAPARRLADIGRDRSLMGDD